MSTKRIPPSVDTQVLQDTSADVKRDYNPEVARKVGCVESAFERYLGREREEGKGGR